jgi:hypothetical protein
MRLIGDSHRAHQRICDRLEVVRAVDQLAGVAEKLVWNRI